MFSVTPKIFHGLHDNLPTLLLGQERKLPCQQLKRPLSYRENLEKKAEFPSQYWSELRAIQRIGNLTPMVLSSQNLRAMPLGELASAVPITVSVLERCTHCIQHIKGNMVVGMLYLGIRYLVPHQSRSQ